MPLRPCLEPGCVELTTDSRCFTHRRPESTKRGYNYRWEKTRAAFLRAHPRCVDCGHPATEAHHIDGLGPKGPRGHDWTNLMPLCKSDHSKRTMGVGVDLASRALLHRPHLAGK